MALLFLLLMSLIRVSLLLRVLPTDPALYHSLEVPRLHPAEEWDRRGTDLTAVAEELLDSSEGRRASLARVCKLLRLLRSWHKHRSGGSVLGRSLEPTPTRRRPNPHLVGVPTKDRDSDRLEFTRISQSETVPDDDGGPENLKSTGISQSETIPGRDGGPDSLELSRILQSESVPERPECTRIFQSETVPGNDGGIDDEDIDIADVIMADEAGSRWKKSPFEDDVIGESFDGIGPSHPVYLGMGQDAINQAYKTYIDIISPSTRNSRKASANPVHFVGRRRAQI